MSVLLTAEQAQQIEEALDTAYGLAESGWAEHKYATALATIRAARAQKQAEHEPVARVIGGVFEPCNDAVLSGAWELYASSVRTKDLTDDEIMKINVDTAGIVPTCDRQFHFARAVIAADREKNK